MRLRCNVVPWFSTLENLDFLLNKLRAAVRKVGRIASRLRFIGRHRVIQKWWPEESEKVAGRIPKGAQKIYKSLSEDFEMGEKWLP